MLASYPEHCAFMVPLRTMAYPPRNDVCYVLWCVTISLLQRAHLLNRCPALTIKAFLQRRKQLSQLMAGNSDLNFNRYFRLMALAVINMLFLLPLGIYTMIVNTTETPIYIWRGLSDLHYDFSAVDQYPAVLWRNNSLAEASVMFSEWSFIGCALLFFLFFGFGDEALKHYRKVYDVVAERLGIRPGMWLRLPDSLKWRTRQVVPLLTTISMHAHTGFAPDRSRPVHDRLASSSQP